MKNSESMDVFLVVAPSLKDFLTEIMEMVEASKKSDWTINHTSGMAIINNQKYYFMHKPDDLRMMRGKVVYWGKDNMAQDRLKEFMLYGDASKI